jgi:hypothetical protein
MQPIDPEGSPEVRFIYTRICLLAYICMYMCMYLNIYVYLCACNYVYIIYMQPMDPEKSFTVM